MTDKSKESTQAGNVAVGKVYDYPRNKATSKVSMLKGLKVDDSQFKIKKTRKEKR
jgi:hypothetical protein